MRRHRWAWLGIFSIIAVMGHANAQQESAPAITKFITDTDEPAGFLPGPHALAPEELLLQLGQQIETTDLDCSHFVQWLFEQAGLYYGYAPSRTLYEGMPGFRRVQHPHPGDLIVWPGHVGVVVDPDEQTFLSSLRSGVKTASYTSRYWKRRGHPRFYRYVRKHTPETRQRTLYDPHQGHVASSAE